MPPEERTTALGHGPELLVLSHRVPFPPHDGAAIRTLGLLEGLAKQYQLTILCFDREDANLGALSLEQRVERLRKLGKVKAVRLGERSNKIRFVQDHISSIFTGQPYTAFTYQSKKFESLVDDAVSAGNFAGVHVDSIDLVRYLPSLGKLPLLLTHHNIESQLLRRRANSDQSTARRTYLRFQAERIEAVEIEWAGKARLNVVTSEQDKAELLRLVPSARIQVIPNAVDASHTSAVALTGSRIVFVGGTDYAPNLEALHWFGSQVLPLLRSRGFAGTVEWVGRATPEERERLGKQYGVNLTGYVQDIRPHFEQAACFVAPLRTGGGTRLKILDAWSHGLPVVATSIGCEGLNATDGVHLLVRNGADEFAVAVERLLGEEELRRTLAAAGRALVQQDYSWNVVGQQLTSAYAASLKQ